MSAAQTLVMLAAGGTFALVCAAFIFGFNVKGIIESDQAADYFVRTQYPDLTAKRIMLGDNRNNALFVSTSHAVLYVLLNGDGPVVRRLSASQVRLIADSKMMIDFGDFGFPKHVFSYSEGGLQGVFDILQEGLVH